MKTLTMALGLLTPRGRLLASGSYDALLETSPRFRAMARSGTATGSGGGGTPP